MELMKKKMTKETSKIIKWIDDDIHFQSKRLVNDFEKDKSIHWRIVGMKHLKELILTNF